jgi:hypothetical protein
MDITRHVFGNVLLDSAVFQVLDAASHQVISFFDLFAEEASNKAVILSAGEDPHPKAAGLLTACSYRLLLRINGGLDGVYVRTVAFAAGLLEAVMTAACGAVHSLLSVCVDEDHFLLSVDRGTVLSALPTEERKWIALFANSAVVPKCVLDETKARLLAEADGGHSADQIVDVGAVRLHRLDRWNRDLVAVEDVLWWSEAEWRMLQDMIVSGLRDKLFKLTLSDHKPQSVERCVFLRDKCPVAELFC